MAKARDSLDLRRLIFAGKQLEGGRLLSGYGIQSESALNPVFRQRGGTQSFMEMLTSTTLAHTWDTLDLRHLIFVGKQLEESTLNPALRQRGGTQSFVETLTGKSNTTLAHGTSNTIDNVKAKTWDTVDLRRLIFASKQLEDGFLLLGYGIQRGSALNPVLRQRGGMQIFIETLSGKTNTTLTLATSAAMDNVMAIVKWSSVASAFSQYVHPARGREVKIQDAPDQRRLICAGKKLENGRIALASRRSGLSAWRCTCASGLYLVFLVSRLHPNVRSWLVHILLFLDVCVRTVDCSSHGPICIHAVTVLIVVAGFEGVVSFLGPAGCRMPHAGPQFEEITYPRVSVCRR